MCCNTAHYAINDVEEGSGLEFINLLEEVAKVVKSSGVPKVEMFCSDGARKFDIYGKVFRLVCPDVELAYPDEPRQADVTKAICKVKTSGRFNGESAGILKKLVAEASAPVVLGCTDLRVAFGVDEKLPNGVLVDSLECLADAIVALSDKPWKM